MPKDKAVVSSCLYLASVLLVVSLKVIGVSFPIFSDSKVERNSQPDPIEGSIDET